MKRLERLGTVAFVTVLTSLTFHLIAMSFQGWINTTCKTCHTNDSLASWDTSLLQRCYQAPFITILSQTNETRKDLSAAYKTQFCLPNQYIFAKDQSQADYCLQLAYAQSDSICALGTYNQNYCGCDYSVRTKVALAMAIIAALSLGVMIFFSHIISFAKVDYILKWLLPACFVLLAVTMISIIVVLSVIGSSLLEDVLQLRYEWSLWTSTITDVSVIASARELVQTQIDNNYTVKIGWCFGMEFMAFYFTFISLILYALMFHAKQRPEPK